MALGTLAAIKGGIAVGKWAYNRIFNKPKSFDQTAYGKRLKLLSEQGDISEQARSNIMSSVGRDTGNIAQSGRVAYHGRLTSMGIGDSISGIRGARDYDTDYMSTVAKTGENIETQNELSKARYATQYAQEKSGYAGKIADYNRQTDAGLIEGTLDAASTYMQGKQLERNEKYKVGLANQKYNIEYGKLKLGTEKNKVYSNYLDRKTGSGMPDVSHANAGDITNWVHSAGSAEEADQRLNIMIEALKKVGRLEEYLRIIKGKK